MPSGRSSRLPKYRHYRPKDLAVVRIDGRDIYLGKYDSPESKQKYARLLAQHFAPGGADACRLNEDVPELTIDQLILRFWTERVETRYRKDGRPSDRQYHVRAALRPLRALYGTTAVRRFGPKDLKLVRTKIIDDGIRKKGGLSRRYVNDHIGIIKRMFRWAVAEELIPLETYQLLETLENIEKVDNEVAVREREKVHPANLWHVRAVLRVVSPQIRAMIRLQLWTGMRPDEVTIMRPCDIRRDQDVWIYVPEDHKMDYKDIERIVPVGPNAQKILAPWLVREPTAYIFSPREVYEAALQRRRKNGKPSRRPKKNYARQPREHYDDETYCQAVVRACAKAGVPKWTPRQLRHNAATRIERKYDREVAQLVLGHRSGDTTEGHIDKDTAKMIRAMRKIG